MNRGKHSDHRRDDHLRDRNYRNMPAVTNRQWGAESRGDEAWSYGYEGQGGYGDFTQGGYGESQGRHAQSGHGRGGSDLGEHPPRSGTAGRPIGGHRGRGPRDYVRSDERIADDLIGRMTDHDRLDATQILVSVEDGVVTLTGEVPERRMKHMAEDLADEVRGVRDIENRIRVDNGTASAGPPERGGVRSGNNQVGSGFSSSGRIDDPIGEETVRVGRAGVESNAPERHVANLREDDAGRDARSSGKK